MRQVSQSRWEKPEEKDAAASFGKQEPGATASVLNDLIRSGAKKMLEAEVQEFLSRYGDRRDDESRRCVVRNGHLPERTVLTGAGRLEVKQPRVRNRGETGESGVELNRQTLGLES